MNLFQNILDKAKSQFINTDQTQTLQYKAINKLAGGVSAVTWQWMSDPTQSYWYKAIQWWANLYTWLTNKIKETAQTELADQQKAIDAKVNDYANDLAKRWLSREQILSVLDELDKKWELTAKPWLSQRIVGGLWERMQTLSEWTQRLSQEQNLWKRLGAGSLFYAGNAVATPFEPVGAVLQPVVEPVMKPIIQSKAGQSALQYASQFDKENPIASLALQWVGNLSQLAPVPFAKPVAWAVKKWAVTAGKSIVKTAEKVAPKVVQGVKTGAEVTWNVVSAPFKSIYKTAKQYVWTPDEIAGIQSAIKPKQKVKNGVVQRSQKQIDSEIQLTNGIIRNKWVKPTDLETYATAQKDILKEIGGKIERLTGQPLDIDVTPSSGKIRMLANSKEVQLLDPSEAQKLLRMADDLDANPRMSLADAEAMNQYINDVLRSTTSTASEAYKRWLQILVQDLRDGLDSAISNIPWEFKDLKRAYGAVRNVYWDTIARQIVFNRQNMGGLIDSFGAIEWFGNIMGWAWKIVTGKVWEWFVDIGKGVTQNTVWRFIKSKNDPNNIIRAIFEKWGKENIIPDIKAKPKEPTPLLPARATPRAIPLGKSQAEIIAESKKGLSPNVKRPNGNTTWNSTNSSPVLDMGTTKGSKQKITPTPKKEVKSPLTLSTKGTMERKSLKQSPDIDKKPFTLGIKKPIVKRSADVDSGLIEEARKYKSAEEFIKAQGEPVFHWTNETFDTFDFEKALQKWERWWNLWWFWFYTTPRLGTAQWYGKNIISIPFKPKNPLDLSKFKTKQELADYLDMSEDAMTMINWMPTASQTQASQMTSHALELWHDAIIANKWNEIVILKPENFKTTEQLKYIYKKAQGMNAWFIKVGIPEKTIKKSADIDSGLIEEARKYKSAEEFVKNKAIFSHWTNAEFEIFDKTKIKVDNLSKWFYFFDDITLSKSYAKRRTAERWWKENIIKAYLDMKKPFNAWKPTRDEAESYLRWYYSDSSLSRSQIDNAIKSDFQDVWNNYNLIFPSSLKDLELWFKKEWYDSLIVPWNDKITGKEWVAYVVFEPSQIKTESQLKKIYEQSKK